MQEYKMLVTENGVTVAFKEDPDSYSYAERNYIEIDGKIVAREEAENLAKEILKHVEIPSWVDK